VPFGKRWLAGFQTRFYNQCDLIYVPSESIAHELVALGIRSDLITIWKRGIDAQLFSPEKRNIAEMQKRTGSRKKHLLFASRLVWEKNLQALIDLYKICIERDLPYHIVVAGDGVAAKSCKEQMPKATFLGTLSHTDLARVYASCDVFFFPSVSESYGNVVLEAMASGIPCVIADGGGSRDFVTQGVNGYKCEPYDAYAYLTHIERLINDTDEANQITQTARDYALSFDWEELVSRYFRDVDQLVTQSQPSIPTP
jgi:glycosyltransferase involved in cell wall biosynthesis